MKYIINESKLYDFVNRHLNSNFGDLEVYEDEEYPEQLFFMKDGEVVFDYNDDNGTSSFSKNKIISFLKDFMGLEGSEIKNILKRWVFENYGLNVRDLSTIPDDLSLKWKRIKHKKSL
jgi:hypothetical protein